MLGLDLVERQFVQRLADNLQNSLELVARRLVFQAGLIGLPPFLGELAEQARSLGASLLVVTVLSWISSLGKKSQGVNRLVLGLGELKARRLGRTKTHLFHDAVALVAECPAATATWRDDQIKVVATGVFTGADGKIVFCGDFGLSSVKLHGRFQLLSLARNCAFGRTGDYNSNRGTAKGTFRRRLADDDQRRLATTSDGEKSYSSISCVLV